MKKTILGRKQEMERLTKYIDSDRSEFIAIYGRRRVGKTFLVKELFDGLFSFRLTGLENVQTREQLLFFSYAMNDYFGVETLPATWFEAFRALSKALEKCENGKKIIFIDELPWLDTPNSAFVSAFEAFWNNWAYYRSDIKLIVCGSATSWMLNNLINSRGGLHNRVTHSILISPFTLQETEQYFKNKGFAYSRSEVLISYMTFGGVAYYLSLFDNKKSVAENVNALCFERGAELADEFHSVFNSLFKNATNYIAVISALSSKGKGLTRTELVENTKLPNNGKLSSILTDLKRCEFIRAYIPFGKKKKDELYQLVDLFTLFHYHFMDVNANFNKDYWIKAIGTPKYNSWCGYAFEIVCLHHIDQILDGLSISGMINQPCSWVYRPSNEMKNDDEADPDLKTGAQIDLLIDRNDNTITICEMKYSNREYDITKEYDKHVHDRMRTFQKVTKTRKTLTLAYITPNGLSNNVYSRMVRNQVTADELFG